MSTKNEIYEFFEECCDRIDLEKLLMDIFGMFSNIDDIAPDPDPEPFRADGRCICEICNKEYRRHPFSHHRSFIDGEPYLNRLCDGSLVKL